MEQNWLTIIIYFGVIVLIFWLLIIRPRKTQEKKQNEMIESLRKGQKVVTIGGLRGTIARVKEDFVQIRVAENTEIEVLPKAIAYLEDDD
ncbi:MAG TPA: preprotein translocase subunit YajC [Syntrophomonadaceae bacterium]|nr:preprotein translocase subunit YajC [Syntrophomonadaceae bacterium]